MKIIKKRTWKLSGQVKFILETDEERIDELKELKKSLRM